MTHRPPRRSKPRAGFDSFVGREDAVVEVHALLATSRLVTLCGPAGIGKTRLACEVAARAPATGAEATWFASLEATTDGALVPATVAQALSLHELPAVSALEAVVALLGAQRVILVLDNCEHLVAACADFVEELLGACGEVRVLATSREPLGVAGEVVWTVPQLPVPRPGDGVGPDAADHFAGVRLFCDRAAAALPGFALDHEGAGAVAEICRRLDGLPLAIELAAARVPVLSPIEIAARMDDGPALLTQGRRTAPARHQTLHAAVMWSYELLDPPEQALFRRLSVFAGGADLDTVREVCAGGPVDPDEVLATVASLVSKSLAVADTSGASARYRLLLTMRQFANDRLVDAGEASVVRDRHLWWCARLAARAESELTGRSQQSWLERLGAEQDNLRAALGGALGDGRAEAALNLSGALTMFWRIRGDFTEGRQWLEAALAAGAGAPALARAKGLWGAGFMALMLDDRPVAASMLDEALALFRQLGDVQGCARAMLLLANCRILQDPSGALGLLSESTALARACGDDWGLAHALALGALAQLRGGAPGPAREMLEQSLATARAAGEPQGIRIALLLLGSLEQERGDLRRAGELLGEGLQLARRLGESYAVAGAAGALGRIAAAQGDSQRAADLLAEALAAARRACSPSILAEVLCALGALALAGGDHAGARRHYGEALAVAGEGCHLALGGVGRIDLLEGDLASARARFEEALAASRRAADDLGTADALADLGTLARCEDRLELAASLHLEALAIRHGAGALQGVAESLEAMAGLAALAGATARALKLFGAAEALRAAHGWARRAPTPYDDDLVVLSAAVNPGVLAAARGQGAALRIDEAVALADGHVRHQPATSGWASVTPAQRRVLDLAARGLTSAEIGERLNISRRTAESHLAQIYTKLGISSRKQLRQLAADEQPRSAAR